MGFLDKAGDLFDQRTGGRHAEHTDTAQGKAGEFLTGRKGDAPAAPSGDTPGAGRPTTGGRPPA